MPSSGMPSWPKRRSGFSSMRLWKTLSRRTVLDQGKFLSVELHTVELPDGRVLNDWEWVITPNYVTVVAVTESGEFVCFEQTKYAVPDSTLGVVGGYIEPGEEPLAAAQRELLEETGYTAGQWACLGTYAVDGNRGIGTAHFFLAQQARKVAAAAADDLEEQRLLLLSRREVYDSILAGEFKVLPWAAALAQALLVMGSG